MVSRLKAVVDASRLLGSRGSEGPGSSCLFCLGCMSVLPRVRYRSRADVLRRRFEELLDEVRGWDLQLHRAAEGRMRLCTGSGSESSRFNYALRLRFGVSANAGFRTSSPARNCLSRRLGITAAPVRNARRYLCGLMVMSRIQVVTGAMNRSRSTA